MKEKKFFYLAVVTLMAFHNIESILAVESIRLGRKQEIDKQFILNFDRVDFKVSSSSQKKNLNSGGNQTILKSRGFIATNSVKKRGKRHTRYQQFFKGIPVWGKQIITHSINNEIVNVSGSYLTGIEGDIHSTDPLISKQNSLSNAIRASGVAMVVRKKADLVIFNYQKKAVLAWIVDVSGLDRKNNPVRRTIAISAEDGKVLENWNNLQHADIATGPGGNLLTGRYQYGSDFNRLDVMVKSKVRCVFDSKNVKTVNLNGTYWKYRENPFDFNCFDQDSDAINGAYSPLNDAHYFGNIVFEMYKNWLDQEVLPFKLTMRVHFGQQYENAFWDGSAMTFGDGFERFHPLVSLDIVAHEVSHGFTEFNSNLNYWSQSGGINEAFSDIAGEAAEFYMKGTNDFLSGADIMKDGSALRYLCDPPLDGVSIGHADDYIEGIDVHYSSGVFNKAFCLLAKKSGWDTKKAFEIFADANQNYWSSDSDFADGACHLIGSPGYDAHVRRGLLHGSGHGIHIGAHLLRRRSH